MLRTTGTIGIVEPLDIADDDRALEQFNKSVCFENVLCLTGSIQPRETDTPGHATYSVGTT